MNFDYNFYNLVLSEVVARIASDQIIIEKEASDLIVSSNNKKFKNIYFDGKDELMKRVDIFQNNPEWYEKNGIPRTLGILLHNSP